MTSYRTRVSFSETLKEVKTEVTLEVESDTLNHDDIVAQAEALYDKAKAVADFKTLKKLSNN